MRPSIGLLLLLAFTAPGFAQRLVPGPFEIQVKTPEGAALPGALVRVGGRFAACDAKGAAVIDGLPAGRHRVVFRHPGYELVETEALLPEGQRIPLALLARPVVLVEAAGKVWTGEPRLPLAGASLRLTPLATAAGVSGELRLAADFEGGFAFAGVPAGTWRLELQAPGFRGRSLEVELAPGRSPLEVVLEREELAADLTVEVADAAGRPAAGVKVVLGEATAGADGPSAPTDALGRARFAKLRIGVGNGRDAEGRLPVLSRQAVARVEAEGRQALAVPVVLRPGASQAVRLLPAATLNPGEGDEQPAGASSAALGQAVTLALASPQDVDHVRVEVPFPLRAVLEVRGAPCHLRMALLDRTGREFASKILGPPGGSLEADLSAGVYFLRAGYWSGAHAGPFEVRLSGVPVVDAYEENDRPGAERLLAASGRVRAHLFPAGDVDRYRLRTELPGLLRLRVLGTPNHLRVALTDLECRERASAIAGPASGACEAFVPAGEWRIVLTHWSGPISVDPYELEVLHVPGDGVEVGAARVLGEGVMLGSTLWPAGENDRFSVPVAERGLVQVRLRTSSTQRLALLDARGRELGSLIGGPGTEHVLTVPVGGPTRLEALLTHWTGPHLAHSPSLLAVHCIPADEEDLRFQDDEARGARPLLLGDPWQGTLLPAGDTDFGRFEVDHPGWLVWRAEVPGHMRLALRNQAGAEVWSAIVGGASTHRIPLRPGGYLAQTAPWNCPDPTLPYRHSLVLERACPEESPGLSDEAPRPLLSGRARPFAMDQAGDVDRFRFVLPQAADLALLAWLPEGAVRRISVVDGATGRELAAEVWGPVARRRPLAFDRTMDLKIEAQPWSGAPGPERGWLLVGPPDAALAAEAVAVAVDPWRPALVEFARAPLPGLEGVEEIQVDADGDGRVDGSIPREGSLRHLYASEGLYRATVRQLRRGSVVAEERIWVDAAGPAERRGIRIVLVGLGEQVEEELPLGVRVFSYDGVPIRSVAAKVGGRLVADAAGEPWELAIPWADLPSGALDLAVEAVDARGGRALVERRVTRSPFFGLWPPDGARVTGESLDVRWRGEGPSPRLRVKPAEGGEWSELPALNERWRSAVLAGLEPGGRYLFQPVEGERQGPARSLARVKGLAFARRAYAATIRREYDQRIPVSLRNDGERPVAVRLGTTPPPPESGLLASFVGEGAEGRPVDLGPGEEREFLLAVSAQNAVREEAAFECLVETADAHDRARVELRVLLPRVDLVWEELEAPAGADPLERKLRLRNRGDSLTDLDLSGSDAALEVIPLVRHGLFPAGETLELRVRPVLHEGWTRAAGKLRAQAVGRSIEHGLAFALPSGERVYAVPLWPGASRPDSEESLLHRARAAGAAWLDPARVDWSRRTPVADRDGDGRPDRFAVVDAAEHCLWSGDDLDRDGEVDHVRVDVGRDGVDDAAWLREPAGGWRPTAVAEAWVEMGFELPTGRNSTIPHSVEILVGGTKVGGFADAIPEGNYRWPVPLDLLPFDAAGRGGEGQVEVRTARLGGGDYVVGRDLRFHVRAIGATVFSTGASPEEALGRALKRDALLLDRVDLSVSGGDLELVGEPAPGRGLEVVARLASLGAAPGEVAVALRRIDPDGRSVELSRVLADFSAGAAVVRLPWTAAPGRHALAVAIDPDERFEDADRANNQATLGVSVPGQDAPPALEIRLPAEGQAAEGPTLELSVLARDDAGAPSVEVSVDGGLPQELAAMGEGLYEGRLLLQPGSRRLVFRARDAAGNRTELARSVQVMGRAPELSIAAPLPGAPLAAGPVQVRVACGEAERVALRLDQGPWSPIAPEAPGAWSGRVVLLEGVVVVAAMAVDRHGRRSTATVRLEVGPGPEKPAGDTAGSGTSGPGAPAPQAGEPGIARVVPDPNAPRGPLEVPGLGPIDPLSALDPLLPPPGAGRPGRGAAAGEPDAPAWRPRAQGSLEEPLPPLYDGGFGATSADPWAEEPPPVGPEAGPAGQVEPESGRTQPEETSGSGARTPGPRPAGLSVKARQYNRHCTNRPRIAMKFRLPEWLKNKDLSRFPPGSPEYKKMVADLLAGLRARGFDPSRLEQMQELLRRRIGRLDQSDGRLPGWLESMGLVDPPPSDPAALAAWRKSMLAKADMWYLRLLSSGDPELVAQGLKARAEAIGQFDQALLEHAEAAMAMVKAHQQVITDVAETIPVLGDCMDLVALATGETLSGEKLTAFDAICRLLSVGPNAVGQLLQHSAAARKAVEALAELGGTLSSAAKAKIAKALGLSDPAQLGKALDHARDGVALARGKDAKRLAMEAELAAKNFASSAAGRADKAAQAAGRKQAEELLEKLRKAEPGSDEFRRLANEWQSNKTAQALVLGQNADEGAKGLRGALQEQLQKHYDQADQGVRVDMEALWKQDPGTSRAVAESLGLEAKQAEAFRDRVRQLAEKNGVDPKHVTVDVWNPTNSPGSLGRDRDITYVLKGPDGKVLGDIDHALTKGAYDQHFWQATRGASDVPRLPDGRPDFEAMGRWSGQLDQTVTSAKHLEAYNTGGVQLKDFLAKDKVPTLTRIEDVRDTMVFKSDHWFHAAKQAGDPIEAARHTAEGMRQATKQWDNMVGRRMAQYGVDASAVPARLQTSVEILKKVDAGAVSPAQAEAMLAAIGTTKEQAVREMAGFLEGLEKTAGAAWRRTRGAELAGSLSRLPSKGTAGWLEKSLGAINGGLASGVLSGPQFQKMRSEVLAGRSGPLPQAWISEALGKGLISPGEAQALAAR